MRTAVRKKELEYCNSGYPVQTACRGSISVYVLLSLLVLIALLFAAFDSLKVAAARTALASSAEQSLYSLFACYDRELYEEYGLLFFDAGYGGEEIRFDAVLQELEENASYILNPAERFSGMFGRDLLQLDPQSSAVQGYVLATDAEGNAFRRQIRELMKQKTGIAVAEGLVRRLSGWKETAEEQGRQRAQYSEANADRYYQEQKAASETILERAEEGVAALVDPTAEIGRLQSMGIFQLVLPEASAVSAAEIDLAGQQSRRELQRGMGVLPAGRKESMDRFLELKYLLDYFPCYTQQDTDGEGALSYQLEYAIAGKGSDAENLRSVLGRLLAVREASNMLHLMTDGAKSAQADALGLALATVLLNPEIAPAISFGIKAAWSFGESVCDLRELLSGGKIPLVKTEQSWQLSLADLPFLLGRADSVRHGTESGLAYEDYLGMFLIVKSAEELNDALMDLVEQNVGKNRSGFRLDNCLDSLTARFTVCVGTREYSAVRSYGYQNR